MWFLSSFIWKKFLTALLLLVLLNEEKTLVASYKNVYSPSLIRNKIPLNKIVVSKSYKNQQNQVQVNSRYRLSATSTSTTSNTPSSSPSSNTNDVNTGVPRLHHDLSGLIKWIEKSGGLFDANVQKNKEGWNLIANRDILPGEILLSIPKNICIYANPMYMETPLLENAELLMSSVDKSLWRARLAIALLSERVRPKSSYR